MQRFDPNDRLCVTFWVVVGVVGVLESRGMVGVVGVLESRGMVGVVGVVVVVGWKVGGGGEVVPFEDLIDLVLLGLKIFSHLQ